MLTKKIVSFLNFIRLFKNWHKAILCWYSKTNDIAVLKLRDGTLFKVRPGKSDIQMIIEIYIGKSYHKYLDKLPANPVIIDIGANIGTFSVFITKLTKSKSIVFAYEPFAENFKFFEENLKLNNINTVKPFQIAAAGTNEDRFLRVDHADNAMHSFFIESDEKIPVKTTTLDSIFKDNNLDSCGLLKLDCEGAEYEIILNTPPLILEKIKIISIEFHRSEKYNHNQLREYLEHSGFNVNVMESITRGFGFIDAIRNN